MKKIIKKMKIKLKIKKNNKKNISENIDPRGSGPVPFGSASQTATNSGGFGALSLQTWEKKYLRKY